MSLHPPNPAVYEFLLSQPPGTVLTSDEMPPLLVDLADIIVVSQSCDIAKPECDKLLVCSHRPATDYTKDSRISIAKDRAVSLHMIEAFEHDQFGFSQRVLDFRTVFSLPKEFLNSLANARASRVRLLPPYREHMAQAFAKYFMRVGLPRNLTVK